MLLIKSTKINFVYRRYELAQYDAQVLGPKYVPTETQYSRNAGIKCLILFMKFKKGDNLYSISRKYNVFHDDLKQKNKLSGNTLSIGQILMVR
jgi:hypothetical protein